MEFLKLVLTTLLSVVALFVITKLMGHKQVAQLDFFDYVSGITIGSIGAELATELTAPWQPLVALILYGMVSLTLSLLTRKLPRTRRYINGTPTVLMNNGKLYRENLKHAKLDLSEFMLLCREQGFFDLDEIKTAIFEHNGKLSILPRAAVRPVTPADLKLAVPAAHVGTEVIMDGHLLLESLHRLGIEERWLRRQVKKQGYKSIKELLLGVYYSETGRLSLYPAE